MKIPEIIISIFLAQAIIASIINYINGTRSTKGFWDFLRLIFLPYVLLNIKSIRED